MEHLSVVDDLLDLGIQANHLMVKFRVIADHDLGIPTGGDKNRLDTARDGCRKNIGNLESNEERKRQDDGGEAASLVVGGFGNLEVDVGEQGASVADGQGSKGKDGSNKTFLHHELAKLFPNSKAWQNGQSSH